MSWSIEEVQQRVGAATLPELWARRAGLEERVRKRGAAGYALGHDDGADFELKAIHYELRTRSRTERGR